MGKIRKEVWRYRSREYLRMFPDDVRRRGLLKAVRLLVRGQWGLINSSLAVARTRLTLMSLIRRIQGRQAEIMDDIEL